MKFIFLFLFIAVAHGYQTPVYPQRITELVVNHQCQLSHLDIEHGLWYLECTTTLQGGKLCRYVLPGQSATCPNKATPNKAAWRQRMNKIEYALLLQIVILLAGLVFGWLLLIGVISELLSIFLYINAKINQWQVYANQYFQCHVETERTRWKEW